MKKSFKKLLFLLFCFLVMGCANKQEYLDSEEEIEKEELVLWSYYETKSQKNAMDELISGFNQAQKNYHLTWEYHGPVTEFNKKLAIAITQDQLPDMIVIDNPDMFSYISMNMFEEITDSIKQIEGLEYYFPSSLEATKYQGKYYGLPFCCNNVALIYNKDLIDESEVPKNWEELKQTAKKLSQDDQYGFAMSAINGEQSAFQFLPFLLSAGDTLEEAGGVGTQKAFQLIQDLVKEGSMSKECINFSQNDVAKNFIMGKCAMMINGPWVFPELDMAGINYGISHFVSDNTYEGVLGGEVLAILKGKNIEGSIAFLNYYGQEDVMLNINLMANSLPPRQDVADQFLKVKPEYEIIVTQMRDCISRTSYRNWKELSQLLSTALYEIIVEEATAEEVSFRIWNTFHLEES